ncbi:MAG TPA: copper ion binding protein, partial [Methyloceanibacter sp.]|nr:copper ion binding protein [Methyloceanibacter sp.]
MNNTKSIDAAAAETSTVKPSEHIDLRIGGMTCPHCPPAIEKALAAVPGVTSAHVNLASNIARIRYEPSRTKLADIVQAIRSIGYVPGTATLRIPIKNMHCSSCSMLIEFALRMTPGVVNARVSLGPNAADVEYDPEKVDFDGIRQAIEQAGYHVAEPKLKDQADLLDPAEAALQEEYRTLMRKFWFAA